MAIRVNVTTTVNTKGARKETRNGRAVIVVPSATLPDNVVMNDIMYPADEIEKGYKSLERTPAPFNHPMVNGKFVSARDPEGLNQSYIGAWNENVRRVDGRVHLDKVIDVELANSTANGKRVIDAINSGKPIHTSTGLLCNVTDVAGQKYKRVASNMEFDHDAILLDVSGAATPAQGVGIFVNSQGQNEEIEVVNSALDLAESDLDYAMDTLARALDRRERAPMIDRIRAAVLSAFGGDKAETTNVKEPQMSKEEFDKLGAQITGLNESIDGIGKAVGEALTNAMKPLVDAHNASAAAAKAAEDAEKAELVKKVVKANLLSEEAATGAPLATLKALTANMKDETKPAARLNTAMGNTTESPFKAPTAEGK